MATRLIRTSASRRLPFASANYATFSPYAPSAPFWRSSRLVAGLGLAASPVAIEALTPEAVQLLTTGAEPAGPTASPESGTGFLTPAAVVALAGLFAAPRPVLWNELVEQSRQKAESLADRFGPELLDRLFPEALAATLTPIGILNIYRQYLYEGDTYLGPSVDHVWLSPGSSLEITQSRVVHSSTERGFETFAEARSTREDALSEMTELSEKLGSQSSTDSRFGVSVSASGSYGVVSSTANVTANLSKNTTESHETVYRQSHQRSSKASEEQRKSVKINVKSLHEETDTTTRRSVLQNNTSALVNYELCLKMREVKIQSQFLGTRLCWINRVWVPGRGLATSQLVHLPSSGDYEAAVGEPPAPHRPITPITGTLVHNWIQGTTEDKFEVGESTDVDLDRVLPPGTLVVGQPFIQANAVEDNKLAIVPDGRVLHITRLGPGAGWTESGGGWGIVIDYATDPVLVADDRAKQDEYDRALAAYQRRLLDAQYVAFVESARERIDLSSKIAPRPTSALRQEERIAVMRQMMVDLLGPATSNPALTNLLAQIFDFDEIFYFVAPDWWLPRAAVVDGQELAPPRASQALGPDPVPTDSVDLRAWATNWGSNVRDYFITEESVPAPLGASIGWMLQLDGDERRNAFLNSPFVQVLVPIRPGNEAQAVAWLKLVEGPDGAPSGHDLDDLVGELQAAHDAEGSRSLKVYQEGYAPLEGSIVAPREADGVFAEWTEVVPTSQVVAVEIEFADTELAMGGDPNVSEAPSAPGGGPPSGSGASGRSGRTKSAQGR